MKILISNDDGYQSTGIKTLASCLRQIADIVVMAPDSDRSAASNSLTLGMPLRIKEIEQDTYAVNGTPTDCVHLGVTGIFKDSPPDMVVSGINCGENLGDDVIYSGTVAAAMEGRFLGFPAFAVSLVSDTEPTHYETAAEITKKLILAMQDKPLLGEILLNVNVPDLPLDDIKGIVSTRLGNRHVSESVICSQDPKGDPIYWVGAPGGKQDAGEGTDFHAVEQGYVSVSPLQIDLTRHKSLDGVQSWLQNL